MRVTTEQAGIIRRELARFDPRVIYVFGSWGTPLARRDSDMDIAFLASDPQDPVAVFDAANDLASALGVEVDLVDILRASTVMRKEILRTGEVIHAAHERAWREFEMLTLSDYARLNEERREFFTSPGR